MERPATKKEFALLQVGPDWAILKGLCDKFSSKRSTNILGYFENIAI